MYLDYYNVHIKSDYHKYLCHHATHYVFYAQREGPKSVGIVFVLRHTSSTPKVYLHIEVLNNRDVN